jgi:hypothetical protein
MAADLKLAVVNQALTAIGEDAVTSITGDSACTRAAIQHYEDIVAEELERNQPKYALRTVAPTLLTALSLYPLQYQWQIPPDCLSIVAVEYMGWTLEGDKFELENGFVRCYYNSNITFRYIFRAPEATWNPQFRRIIEQRLEALFLRVTERFSAADGRDASTERKSQIARHTDAMQRRNRPVGGGSIVEARRGLRPLR